MEDAILNHVKNKQDAASATQTLEEILADFNYGTTSDDLLIFKATVNRLFSQDYAADASELSAKFFDNNE
jgi:hypothetical protein